MQRVTRIGLRAILPLSGARDASTRRWYEEGDNRFYRRVDVS
jgi:hypothetical protein